MPLASLHPANSDRREGYETARLRLVRMQVPGAESLGEVLRRATELAAETLSVERVGIWLLVDGRQALRCFHLYERSKHEHSEGAVLRAEDFPTYFRAIEERRFLVAADVTENALSVELLNAYLNPLNIKSMLDMPIYREGNVIGVVCHEAVGETRSWSDEQRDFAASVADTVSLQIEMAERRAAQSTLQTMEQHLAELHKLDSLAQVARGVAHDFKNVLMVISGLAELITTSSGCTTAVAKDAEQILRAVERGRELVGQLIAFGRSEPRCMGIVDMAELLQSCKGMLETAVGKTRRLTIHCQPALGRVLADRAEIERVVLNLVLNARDATPHDGTIAIRVSIGKVADENGAPSAYVVVSVSDTGAGMEPLTLERAFEPFFTTKANQCGAGLGLSIVQHIAERYGGFVHLESKLGAGTTVRVYLPRIATEQSLELGGIQN